MRHDVSTLVYLPIAALKPFPGNPRQHSPKQIRQVATSIKRFGFKVPVLVSDDEVILAGHCRVDAARLLGWEKVPCIRAGSMTEAEMKAFIVADNQLATLSTFDSELLSIVFSELTVASEIDVAVTGFSQGEVEAIIEIGGNRFDSETRDDADAPLSGRTVPVTQPGDIWTLGDHRLICGDARNVDVYSSLLGMGGVVETA
ncbi:ParB/Srx family N-terminal domain-containing protein [Mesorhizobium sp. CN2-181]|uniref:ParB/Srx family N-terminal domain-containing protein n=1 Tax=Mesorhizobium yinganensis TaxID=3157707 RepID=UPI0032B809B2